jgi:hypothetical protein
LAVFPRFLIFRCFVPGRKRVPPFRFILQKPVKSLKNKTPPGPLASLPVRRQKISCPNGVDSRGRGKTLEPARAAPRRPRQNPRDPRPDPGKIPLENPGEDPRTKPKEKDGEPRVSERSGPFPPFSRTPAGPKTGWGGESANDSKT